MTNRGTRLAAAAIISGLVLCVGSAGTAVAQLSSKDQACIAAFNKGVRKVAKAQGKVVAKCLAKFAAGTLSSTTPEACALSDPNQTVDKAVQQASAKIGKKCASLTPPFGISDVPTALSRASLSQVDLIHDVIGRNLDLDLIANPDDAACQSKVGATMLKCVDRRVREYLKCQKISMRVGDVTDATSLTNTCLGTGANPQPDPFALINNDCNTKVSSAVSNHCGATDLLAAFGPCAPANDPAATAACLKQRSACQLCLMLNDVDTLNRDCDLFDDGNAANGSCGRECGDGIIQAGEACDDHNTNDNDGCSALCTPEGGYTCTGEPSVCTPNCGNGAIDAGETCDDGDTQSGDGCSNSCIVESGYSCTGQPSVCTHNCGNGSLDLLGGEVCDDGDTQNGDGCSSTCQVEDGYNCAGSPSVCTFVCGNGTFQQGETCDDGDAQSGDGCDSVCKIETGWLCSGAPSVCMPTCGDGLKRGGESCDDGNQTSGDGCSSSCQTESGFQCAGQPSHCLAICGDGFIRGFETCDDSNVNSGDGCSGDFCRKEAAFNCAGQPSLCTANCGDANLDSPEQCDDGNHTNGDGCNANCLAEPGYVCAGQPSICSPTCGNGVLNGSEECDDGNTNDNDGCSGSCTQESGWVCPTPGLPCVTYDIFIDTPANGLFTTGASVIVTGHYTVLGAGQGLVTINGVPAAAVNPINRTFTHTVILDPSKVFNPIRATLTNIANGDTVHDRIVVINGPSVADGVNSPQSVALRINDSALDTLEPLVAELAGGQLNLGAILPSGTALIDDECFINAIGCWGSASARIGNPPPSFSSFSIAIDSKTNAVNADIRVNNLRVDVDIDGSGLVPDCGLRLTANQMQLTGDYSLEPKVGDLSNIDVNLIGSVAVNFSGFSHTFTYGLCDAPIIGDIIQAFLPDIEQVARDGIAGFINDPDGAGPQDSPIADAIETVLEGINITGPIGQGLGLMLESPLFAVTEDNNGITLGSSAKFTVSIGNGPGQCIPPIGAPNLTASYSPASSFPTFGPNTPVSHQAYGFGIGINSSGFNQLLRGQTECGLMRTSMTTIDLDGAGGQPPLPITSTLLSLLIPEFAQLPANTPMRIDIAPTLAPIVTGNAGPAGELTELKISQVMMDIVQISNNRIWLRGALDARLGMNLAFLPDGSGLDISLTPPAPGDLTIAIIRNPLHTNAAQVETGLPALIAPLIPDLAGALAGFPLPQFFGFNLAGVEVSRTGQFMSLYANLTPAP